MELSIQFSEEIQNISYQIWNDKYRLKAPDGTSEEKTREDSHRRVVRGVYEKDPDKDAAQAALEAMVAGYLVPAGRIHAGAGTGRGVTLLNCYVCNEISDSMRSGDGIGIMDSLSNAAYTMQMGGGIGMDFSKIRPKGATVRTVGSVASGPLPFMDMWDGMCRTIMSAGSRRGAMMATLSVDHPDIEDFVTAKREKGRLTMFNVSVLISDEFMKAVRHNEDWKLKSIVAPYNPNDIIEEFKEDGVIYYVYKIIKAKDLWEKIIKNTYDFAEPGVIFIDRVNQMNNLWYAENIRSSNPCGEQPLPPNGACNLSAINLAKLVRKPFTDDAFFDFDTLVKVVKIGVRFLDNVLDVSAFPIPEQKIEAEEKRRIGLGITGLANALQQLKIKYGSSESIKMTGYIMEAIRNTAYKASVDLAIERGPCPVFDKEKFLKAKFIQTLPDDIKAGIAEYGIRNGVLLTIAPTGTTSIYYDNISSGIEPTFAWSYSRKVLNPDNSFSEYDVEDYGYRLYRKIILNGRKPNGEGLPDYMVSASELTISDHLAMQEVCQKYIDASISKTINCPTEMTFDDFKEVYMKAYELGLKGCTTYRYNPDNDVRGSVLKSKKQTKHQTPNLKPPRPLELNGRTYKVKWPGRNEANYYITINDYIDKDGQPKPFEIFINTKSAMHAEWIAALTRTISAVFRRGGDTKFLVEELEQVFSPEGGSWVNGRYVPSLVAMIGNIIAQHMKNIGYINDDEVIAPTPLPETISASQTGSKGDLCSKCQTFSVVRKEGCSTCLNCGYSNCG